MVEGRSDGDDPYIVSVFLMKVADQLVVSLSRELGGGEELCFFCI